MTDRLAAVSPPFIGTAMAFLPDDRILPSSRGPPAGQDVDIRLRPGHPSQTGDPDAPTDESAQIESTGADARVNSEEGLTRAAGPRVGCAARDGRLHLRDRDSGLRIAI